MPSTSIRLKPGVDTLATPALNEAGISASNLIRFRAGLVEKRGGWTSLLAGLGFVPRSMAPYSDIDGVAAVAVAGQGGVKVLSGGTAIDIAPRQVSTSPAVSVGVTAGSTTATISDTLFTPQVGDTFTVGNPIAIGGVLLSGAYTVASVVNGAQFTVVLAQAATSSASNGGVVGTLSTSAGSATVTYTLPGAGAYSTVGGTITVAYPTAVGGLLISGTYRVLQVPDANTVTFQALSAAATTATASIAGGLAQYTYTILDSFSAAKRGSVVPYADWSIANYGTDLIACGIRGKLYRWSKTSGSPDLTPIPNAPNFSVGAFVSDAQQMIVAYGVFVGSQGDHNTVAWCDAGNPTAWTASSTNLAGSFRLPTGSGIVGGGVAGSSNLLWTDIDVWAMTYVGGTFVWGFNKLATGCGLVAKDAWAKLGGAVYWMSQNEFWMWNGSTVQALPCTVRDKVFGNVAPGMGWKIRAGANSQFNEVVWFYPSAAGNGENDSYVCFNPVEGTWDYGTMARSAWADQSVLGAPVGADPSGNVYLHETSPDAAGQAMQASFTTGWTLIQEGETFAFVDLIRPDIAFPTGAGAVQVSVLTCAYTTDAPTIAGPFTITAATEFINARCRGRYVALRFASSDLGSFWRLGRVQIRFAPAGRR